MKARTAEARTASPGEEFEVAGIIMVLLRHKVWIIACTILMTALGFAYALLAPPVYRSGAIISLKESGKGGDASRLLSQLGGMGGMVASQLGLGSTSLDKIEIILKGYELAEAVITKNNLLPVLFHDKWDAKAGKWKVEDTSEIPKLRHGIEKLKGGHLSVTTEVRKNVIRVGMEMHEKALAKRVLDMYLAELNNRIRSDVIREAEANRTYLELQLANTSDPIVLEKIHNMIGFEIEKGMLVSTQSFDILEKPVEPLFKSKPERPKIVAMSFLFGLFVSVGGIFLVRYTGEMRAKLIGAQEGRAG